MFPKQSLNYADFIDALKDPIAAVVPGDIQQYEDQHQEVPEEDDSYERLLAHEDADYNDETDAYYALQEQEILAERASQHRPMHADDYTYGEF